MIPTQEHTLTTKLIAILSLLISISTFFSANVLVSHKIVAVASVGDTDEAAKDGNGLNSSYHVNITLVNQGNQPEAILICRYYVERQVDSGTAEAPGIAPLALKPGEITTFQVAMPDDQARQALADQKVEWVDFGYRIDVVEPSGGSATRYFKVGRLHIGAGTLPGGNYATSNSGRSTNYVLHSSTFSNLIPGLGNFW